MTYEMAAFSLSIVGILYTFLLDDNRCNEFHYKSMDILESSLFLMFNTISFHFIKPVSF